jgi:hypothetical protein
LKVEKKEIAGISVEMPRSKFIYLQKNFEEFLNTTKPEEKLLLLENTLFKRKSLIVNKNRKSKRHNGIIKKNSK